MNFNANCKFSDHSNNASQPAKKSRNDSLEKEPPKILQGRFYEIIDRKNGKVTAKCKECNGIKKGTDSSTGNFIMHYKLKHPALTKTLNDYLKGIDPSVSPSSASVQPAIFESFQGASSDKVLD